MWTSLVRQGSIRIKGKADFLCAKGERVLNKTEEWQYCLPPEWSVDLGTFRDGETTLSLWEIMGRKGVIGENQGLWPRVETLLPLLLPWLS